MKSVSMTILLGNVTKDPIVKSLPNGKIATFCVATNHIYNWPNGEKKDEAEYHYCVAWGKTAEIIEQYVKSGKEVHIIGRNKTRSWDDAESGKKVYKTEVNVDQISLLGGRDN